MGSLVSCCWLIFVATTCFVALSVYVFKSSKSAEKESKKVLKKAKAIKRKHDQMREVPKGFPNIGSTCFMNATLQCLIWSPCLPTQLARQIERHCEKFEIINANGITAALLKLVYEVHYSHKSSVFGSLFGGGTETQLSRKSLNTLLNAARKINDQFMGNDQQDSFEIYNTIISGIEDELEGTPEPKPGNYQEMEDPCNFHSVNHIARLFEGKFVNVYYHTDCCHVENVFQSFTSLCIPFPYEKEKMETKSEIARKPVRREKQNDVEGNIYPISNEETDPITENSHCEDIEDRQSMTDIQNRLTLKLRYDKWNSGLERGLEILSELESFDEDVLPCRECRKKDQHKGFCLKLLRLVSLPPVLVFQINRFKQVNTGLVKIQEGVTYPGDIDVGPFCLNTSEIDTQGSIPNYCRITNTVYSLYGVVNHTGTLKGGHYYAYIKTTERQADHIYQQLQERDTGDIEKESERLPEVMENLIKTRPIKTQEQSQINGRVLNDSASWYYVSDKHFDRIRNFEVLNNDDAYILMYELKKPSSIET